jgi:hypothetical protein
LSKKETATIVPGNIFWITADQGGYSFQMGWTPGSGALVPNLLIPVSDQPRKGKYEREEGFYDSDEWAAQREWRNLREHTDEVIAALGKILSSSAGLALTENERHVLNVAARWHDWGKVHPVFQSGLADIINDPSERKDNPDLPFDQRKKMERPDAWRNCPDIAKAPQEYWRKYTRLGRTSTDQIEVRVPAQRFRHELPAASILTGGANSADCDFGLGLA